MADPKEIFPDVKVIQEEKTELVARLVKYNAELRDCNVTNRRRKIIADEVNKINQRLTYIKQYSKTKMVPFYEAFYQVCKRSLPSHCSIELEHRTKEVFQNQTAPQHIKPINIYTEQDLSLKTDLSNAIKTIKDFKISSAELKKSAQQIFLQLNARLTPDEAVRFAETLDFLRQIINSK